MADAEIVSFYVSTATFFLLHCDEWDRIVALPRHKFVTGATLLQLRFHQQWRLYHGLWLGELIKAIPDLKRKIIKLIYIVHVVQGFKSASRIMHNGFFPPISLLNISVYRLQPRLFVYSPPYLKKIQKNHKELSVPMVFDEFNYW
jgi:hypothetical protein